MPLSAAAESALRNELGTPYWSVRRAAAIALLDAGCAQEEALAVLLAEADAVPTPQVVRFNSLGRLGVSRSEQASAEDALRAVREPPAFLLDALWAAAEDPATAPWIRAKHVRRYLFLAIRLPSQAARIRGLLEDEEAAVSFAAFDFFRRRPVPAVAIEVIAAGLQDPSRRDAMARVAGILWYWHERQLPIDSWIDGLLSTLRETSNAATRHEAVRMLGAFAHQREDVRAALLGALDDPGRYVRESAAAFLEPGDSAHAAPMHSAHAPPPDVSEGAAEALRMLSAFTEALSGEDAVARRNAILGAAELAEGPSRTLSGYRANASQLYREAALRGRTEVDPHVRLAAARLLAFIDISSPSDSAEASEPPAWAQWTAWALADSDAKIRRAGARALAVHEGKLAGALPLLLALFADPDAEVAAHAERALLRFGAEAAPALGRMLESPRPRFRYRALRALGQLGEVALPAVPALMVLLESTGTVKLSRRIAKVLGRIGPGAAEAEAALIKLLENGATDATVQRNAAWALGAMAAASPQACSAPAVR